MTAIAHARYTCGEVLGEGAQGFAVRVVDRERPALPLVAKVSWDGTRADRTRDTTPVYTPAFAAPELRAGAAPSEATDLYALGATLWACATGSPPGKPGDASIGALRDRAPWIAPSIAAVVEALASAHPADR